MNSNMSTENDRHTNPHMADEDLQVIRNAIPVSSMDEIHAILRSQMQLADDDDLDDFEITTTAQLTNINMESATWMYGDETAEFISKPQPTSKIPLNLSTSFKYSPLPKSHFRLLEISGLGDFPMGEMMDYPMESPPVYTAISYAWGRGAPSRAFFCNGKSFSVSAHVLDALNHLQAPIPSMKHIWVDAICIDQENDAEKAIQVAHMQNIYARAEAVFVWLGASEDNSNLALDNVVQVSAYSVATFQNETLLAQNQLPVTKPSDEVYRALGHLYARPWFSRVWVVQELLLARKVTIVCGTRLVDWDAFAALTVFLLRASSGKQLDLMVSPTVSQNTIGTSMANVFHQYELRMKGPITNGLPVAEFMKLLDSSRPRKVTEPVDRVWAFLGLAQPGLRKLLAPLIDYSPGIRRDYYKAYVAVAKTLLPLDPEGYLLSIAPSRTRPLGLPSWCPNFNSARTSGLPNRRLDERFTTGIRPKPTGFSKLKAGIRPKSKVASTNLFEPGSDILHLLGFHVDDVEEVISIAPLNALSAEDEGPTKYPYAEVAAWEAKCLALARKIYPLTSNNSVPNAHWRTMVMDNLIPSPQIIEKAYSDYSKLMHISGDSVIYMSAEEKRNFYNFMDEMGGYCERAYFSTRGGRVGRGPPDVMKGDRICVVYGMRNPLILRFPLTSGTGRGTEATLVGDSYVHGIMYGETFKIDTRADDEVFRIG